MLKTQMGFSEGSYRTEWVHLQRPFAPDGLPAWAPLRHPHTNQTSMRQRVGYGATVPTILSTADRIVGTMATGSNTAPAPQRNVPRIVSIFGLCTELSAAGDETDQLAPLIHPSTPRVKVRAEVGVGSRSGDVCGLDDFNAAAEARAEPRPCDAPTCALANRVTRRAGSCAVLYDACREKCSGAIWRRPGRRTVVARDAQLEQRLGAQVLHALDRLQRRLRVGVLGRLHLERQLAGEPTDPRHRRRHRLALSEPPPTSESEGACGLFEGEGGSTSRVSAPGPLSLSLSLPWRVGTHLCGDASGQPAADLHYPREHAVVVVNLRQRRHGHHLPTTRVCLESVWFGRGALGLLRLLMITTCLLSHTLSSLDLSHSSPRHASISACCTLPPKRRSLARAPSVTQRARSVTPQALNVTQRALSVTQLHSQRHPASSQRHPASS
jgi:hypothetical protein